jgi:hypothetical protein
MKIKLKAIVITLIIIAVVAAILIIIPNNINYMLLGSGTRYYAKVQKYSGNKDANKPGVSDPASTIPVPKTALKIIKTADIRFQVKDVEKSLAAIKTMVKNCDGYLASENLQNDSGRLENTIMIRVPAERFDQLIQSLNGQAIYVDSKTIEARDVTEEFVDTEARLNAKKEVEQRYLDILQRAKTVQEILEVEGRLGAVREEIEAVEGKLKYMNDQITYSTITLTIYQPVFQLAHPGNGFWGRLVNALVGGWNSFLAVLVGLVYVWPFVIVLGIGVWIYRRFMGKKKKTGLWG